MAGLRLFPNSSHRKCARVVGEVLGKYHPHGDVAVYDALVRMAQDFATGTPLIDGHGNFGSIDNDPPAAMRYTECRLTSVAHQALLQDLDTDTVDYTPNFDGNEVEPMVLPAKLPFLLLNGVSGIAVGMATNVPPHNLGELMDACIALLEAHDGIRPTLTDTDLNAIVPAPDFPTGAYILGTTASHTLHNTGHGGIILRAKTHIEQISKSRTAIVVTELPYQVNKAALLERLATMVNEKKMDGIADLRDESDREGIRVVIDLKRDALPAVVLNNLFKKTSLQTTFSGNFLALVGSKPERFTLRSALQEFLNFRFTTVRRRAAHQMKKESTRSHIVEGLLKALRDIDTVIDTIRSAPDLTTAREALLRNNTNMSLALTKDQAESVLKLPLGSLTRLNKEKLEEEQKSLKTSMKYLQRLLKEDSVVRKAMIKEFQELKDKFAIPRRTTIESEETGELNDLDLIENTRSVIIVNKGAYIKRMPLSAFESQRRGTRGKRGTSSSGSTSSSSTNSPDDDTSNQDHEVAHCFTCNDHDVLLVISNNGVAFSLRAYQVPQTTRTAKGVPLPSVLPMKGDDYVAAILPISEFPSGEEECIVLVTEHGWIKKTPLDAFQNLTSRGLIIAGLEDGDRLRWAKRCNNEDDILLGTTMGMATRFKASEVRPTGRTSRGITSMKLKDGDKIADMSILRTKLESSSEDHINGEPKSSSQEEEYVLAVTSYGYGKRVRTGEFRSQARGGVGVIATKFKRQLGETKEDTVSCLRVVREEDEVLLVTERGIIMRQKVKDIPCQGRAATGVLLQKVNFKSGDAISSVSVVEPIIE
jgi:DNA gyrase subunit A